MLMNSKNSNIINAKLITTYGYSNQYGSGSGSIAYTEISINYNDFDFIEISATNRKTDPASSITTIISKNGDGYVGDLLYIDLTQSTSYISLKTLCQYCYCTFAFYKYE